LPIEGSHDVFTRFEASLHSEEALLPIEGSHGVFTWFEAPFRIEEALLPIDYAVPKGHAMDHEPPHGCARKHIAASSGFWSIS